MTVWVVQSGVSAGVLGFIPLFLSEADPRPAREQFNERYESGWAPLSGFTITDDGLKYPGDRPLKLVAEAKFREETIRIYECSWVVIIQPDGSFEVDRMD